MKKNLLLLALIALFATNASAEIIVAPATHIDPNGKKTKVNMRFEVTDAKYKRAVIYGRMEGNNAINCLVDETKDYTGEIVVPETVRGCSVIGVDRYAFSNCVAKVTLPESIVTLDNNAFCDYLYDGYDFKIPSNVLEIGSYAFYRSKIKGISLNDNLQEIGYNAFMKSDIESLFIPGNVTKIGNGITIECKNLEYLVVAPDNETYYSDHHVLMDKDTKEVMAGCKNSVIPDDAVSIYRSVFSYIDFKNQTVTIPESVKEIGKYAFRNSNIKHLIVRSKTLEIGEQAFYECRQMERLDFYGDDITIDNYAFRFCTALKEMWCHDHNPNVLPEKDQFQFVGPGWSAFHGQTKIFAKYPGEFTDEVEGKGNIWKYWFYPEVYTLDGTVIVGSIYLDDYTWPLAGEDADFTATALTPHATVSKIEYRAGNNIIDPSPCALGGKLDIGFTINLDEGYTFAENAPLFVGGNQADLVVKRSDTERVYILQDYTVPAPPGGVPIKAVAVNVEEPVEGQPLSTKVTWPTSRAWLNLDWSLDSVVWTGGNLDSYDPTKSYTLTAYIHANTADYTFSPDIVAKLNDKTASVTRGTNSEGIPTLALSVHYGKQVYTVFNSGNNTLTYYYDGNIYSRPGVKEEYIPGAVRFKGYSDKVVKAVIDPSMTDAPMTSMLGMFYGGQDPETQTGYYLKNMKKIEGMENLNTTNVMNMFRMFYNCTSLTSLDLTNFNIDNVQTVNSMFSGCSSLTTIWCNDDWSILDALGYSYRMFFDCTALQGGKDTKYDETATEKSYARPDGGRNKPGYFTATATKGDVNGDGDINTADVTAVYSYITKGADSGFTAEVADVNSDGDINTADVTAIYSIIIGSDKD